MLKTQCDMAHKLLHNIMCYRVAVFYDNSEYTNVNIIDNIFEFTFVRFSCLQKKNVIYLWKILNMREKLVKLMKEEKLTASRLAELLGVRSSGISHIISERNKPSFDLLQKILRRFPNINPDWLLLDSDQMYRDQNARSNSHVNEATQANVLDFAESTAANDDSDLPLREEQRKVSPCLNSEMFARGVKRVILLYDDNTFESYDVR